MNVAARLLAILALLVAGPANADDVRIKDLGRFLGWRDSALVGYGIVTGLTGTGDSPRSAVTRQALTNALGRLGSNVTPDQVQSRNVAAVMITATLPASANVGDRVDVGVTSIGDARSLAGGVLLMTPLLGPNQRAYGLAQGPVVVGGYQFNSGPSSEQRNFPTAGIVSGGGSIEVSVDSDVLQAGERLVFVLRTADVTTATRVADAINRSTGAGRARVTEADMISIDAAGTDLFRLMSQVENVMVEPADLARVVINERSGTVVAGGGVRISSVVISQGDIRVSVSVQNEASQPTLVGGINDGLSSLIVTNTAIDVAEGRDDAVVSFPNTTVGDLIEGLSRARVDTRRKIAILQSIKAAGALHADIIVQ